MLRTLLRALAVAVLALPLFGNAQLSPGRADDDHADAPRFPPFDQFVKGAKVSEGLFRLYHKEDRLYAEIRPDQFDHPLLAPISIARGVGQGGHTLNFGDQWVLMFKRVGPDKVHLIRRNVHFQAKKSDTLAKAVETTYTDSVLMSLRVQTINPVKQSVVINLNDVFMSDFAQLGRGAFDPSRSTWHKIKAFPDNLELQVAATYTGVRGDNVIDSRGATVVVHYGLCKMPDDGYQPRLADDRVGHFLSVVKDFSGDGKDTNFVRYVNRWRLERAEPLDPKKPNKLSAPKKKIIFWIEKSVPEEYRTFVREGILEWNKAFEAIGFKDAIEVRQQENLDDFDPEDVRYNTFRWIANDGGYAMGPSRANPLTGEIIDADIVFDASMVRYYRQQAALFTGSTEAMADAVSPIRAARRGRDLLAIEPLQAPEALTGWDDRAMKDSTPEARAQVRAIQSGLCQCGPCLKRELSLAALALAARDGGGAGDKTTAVDELVGQAIKEVTMHEVGHTLGLRHNFKASTFLKNEDLHNTDVTRKKGLVGSVMDYAPANIAPKGTKQGDYFTTTLGPYDYWAIEYAYKPLSGGTEGEWGELQKIASQSATPGHDYGTDEDLYGSPDPLIHVWDLGADPMKFGMDRIALAEELLQGLADKGSDKGDSYVKTRQAFNVLMQQYGNGAYLVGAFIGGQVIHRDHKGDANGRDAYEPIKGDKQREALKFLQEHVLNDEAFVFTPALLRRLGPDRWMHWGNLRGSSIVETPIHEQILAVQRVVLEHAIDAKVLARIQNLALQADKDDKPLTLAEVFRSLTDGIWTDPTGDVKDPKKAIATTVLRRNLQREHVKELSRLVLGDGSRPPADARSLARMHLRGIGKRIDKVLNDKGTVDDATRAHLEECQERISKVLAASMQANEP